MASAEDPLGMEQYIVRSSPIAVMRPSEVAAVQQIRQCRSHESEQRADEQGSWPEIGRTIVPDDVPTT